MTKRDEVRVMIQYHAERAILLRSARMVDRATAEVLRMNAGNLAQEISYAFANEYVFLELADIMEWRRTRARR